MIDENYLATIKNRAKKSHIYRQFQETGLAIAELLNDQKHKALYIKLAKEYDQQTLLSIAKDVSQRTQIENKGGYFMKVLQSKKQPDKPKPKTKLKPKIKTK